MSYKSVPLLYCNRYWSYSHPILPLFFSSISYLLPHCTHPSPLSSLQSHISYMYLTVHTLLLSLLSNLIPLTSLHTPFSSLFSPISYLLPHCTHPSPLSSLQSHTSYPTAHTLLLSLLLQRPSGKELLKHRFIKNAKKNSCLVDLIDRYRRWKAAGGDSGDDLSDNELERYGSIKSLWSQVCILRSSLYV